EARIVHVGRDRGGAVGRTDGAGDKAGFLGRLLGPGVGGRARDLGGGDIHLVGDVLEPVIGLADRLGIEGVGLDDVGAGFGIGIVGRGGGFGVGEPQEIVVALEVARVVLEAGAAIARLVQLVALDHGAHGAVENEDALAHLPLQRRDTVFSGHDAAFTSAAKALAGRKPRR